MPKTATIYISDNAAGDEVLEGRNEKTGNMKKKSIAKSAASDIKGENADQLVAGSSRRR